MLHSFDLQLYPLITNDRKHCDIRVLGIYLPCYIHLIYNCDTNKFSEEIDEILLNKVINYLETCYNNFILVN